MIAYTIAQIYKSQLAKVKVAAQKNAPAYDTKRQEAQYVLNITFKLKPLL